MSDLVDCHGNRYEVIRMPTNGFCGYHSLSYCLSGSPWLSYICIIDDCISVFSNIPELYRTRTGFGYRRNSSLNVGNYFVFMQNSIRRIQAGVSVGIDSWCEEGHLISVSLLYDIAICVYSVQNKQWHVFNEAGTRGYILLLSSPGHFDVMKGVVPPAAHTHGVSCQSFGASDEVWQFMQRQYSFEFVYAFPEQFTGINILNNPVVQVTKVTMENNDVHAKERVNSNTGACNFPACKYINKNAKALAMHTMRVNKKQRTAKTNEYFCDYPGCLYSNSRQRNVSVHRVNQHIQKPVCTDISETIRISDTLSLTDVNDIQGVVNSEAVTTIVEDCRNDSQVMVDSDGFRKVASRNRLRKMVSSTTELQMYSKCTHLPSTARSINIELTNRFSELPDYNDDRYAVGSCEAADADNDVSFLANVETNGTRPSKPLRNTHVASDVESLSEAVQKEGLYTCDDCGSVFQKLRGLSIHKAKRHGIKVQLSTVVQKEGRYTCDDCGSVFQTSRGLSIHKAKRHATKVRGDDATSIDVEPDADGKSMHLEAVSTTNLDSISCMVRRSARLFNKNKTLNAKDSTANVSLSNDSGVSLACLLYTSPSPRDRQKSRMPSSA